MIKDKVPRKTTRAPTVAPIEQLMTFRFLFQWRNEFQYVHPLVSVDVLALPGYI